MYILETNNLVKKYNRKVILDNLNIHIRDGAIYGLIGKNGSGKTTLIRTITGLIKPDGGTYSIYGVSNLNKDIFKEKKRIGAIIDTPAMYQDMSAKDNLIIQMKLAGFPNYDNASNLLKLVGLEDDKKKVRNFSLGMKGRLGIAIALSNNPDFLILDEPINGLDPEGIIEIRELILKLNKEYKITILISSHYLDELSKVATDYGFIDKGKIIKEIASEDLLKDIKPKFILTVEDLGSFVNYFEEHNITYEVIDEKSVNIYNQSNLAKLIRDLTLANLIVLEAKEVDETLESYYIKLMGGQDD